MNSSKWFSELEKTPGISYIPEEIYITDNPLVMPLTHEPQKNEVIIACLCTQGEIRGCINLVPFCAKASGLLVILPDQILEYEGVSDDFQGIFIIMSKQFTGKFNIPEALPVFISVRSIPYLQLNEKELQAILYYYTMIQTVLENIKEELNRKAIVNHLTIAFFYGLGYYLHKLDDKNKKTRNEVIVEDFLKLVQKHYKQERSLAFYADKLCLTSKYLSVVVKSSSGKTGRQWIDSYVILEAKSLLKSTGMTVQQISDELNFASQSFFGKYFKREAGMSPAQYRSDKSTK